MDLDTGFVGVNSHLDPSLIRTGAQYSTVNQQLLAPGQVSEAVNKRFDRGAAATRRGVVTPVHFNPAGIGTVYGSGVYSNPSGREWLLLAVSDGVWQLADRSAPTRKISLASGQSISGDCLLVQAFDRVLLFRGEDAAPLVWDGGTTGTFNEIPASSAGDYTDPIPNSGVAAVMAGRVFVKQSRDQVAVSDLLEYTRYDADLALFRMNQGEDDAIVQLHPFRRNSLLVLKDQSIYRLSGITGELAGVSVELVNGEIGCAAPYSVATVGGDVFWLGSSGVHRLSETVEQSMIVQETPISRAVEPLIDRINWTKAGIAAAVTHGRFYYLAVPLDSSETNNAILVYDTTTGQWQGYDEFDSGANLTPSRFHRTDYFNRKTAFLIDYDSGRVCAMEQGREDEISGVLYPISDRVLTRGYVSQSNDWKRQLRANFEFETRNPAVTIKAKLICISIVLLVAVR